MVNRIHYLMQGCSTPTRPIGPTARRTSRPFTEGTNWPRSESTERELGMSNVVFSRL